MEIFDCNVQPGSWCIPLFDNVFITPDNREIEIGLYREPDDGSYTLHVFDNDDVIICKTICVCKKENK